VNHIISKSQIDRLGERLRKGPVSDADLRQLDEYRRTFSQTYLTVVSQIRGRVKVPPTGRPAKSTSSIIEKLRRESIRLTQIQDISGCRSVVKGIAAQEALIVSLKTLFPMATVVDRRKKPSSGYRAVHIIVKSDELPVEIQVRTNLQHLWAELSEKLSDLIDPRLKYGGGPEDTKRILGKLSVLVARCEENEAEISALKGAPEHRDEHRRLNRKFQNIKARVAALLKELIMEVRTERRKK
jgi:putative GTP pyrophosphokinase